MFIQYFIYVNETLKKKNILYSIKWQRIELIVKVGIEEIVEMYVEIRVAIHVERIEEL